MEITFQSVVFFILAIAIVIFSVLTVTTRRMLRSATYLLLVLFATAGLYFLLGYTFLGAVQIMVYAGGIVVLYVFSIMLTSGEKGDRVSKMKPYKFMAGLISSVAGCAILLFILLKHEFIPSAIAETTEVPIQEIGSALLSTDKYGYVLPFEAISILLLACIVGGVLIARKR